MWNLSRRDIRFLQTLSYFFAFFGFSPLFRLSENVILDNRKFEVLSISVYFILLMAQIFSAIPVLKYNMAVYSDTQKIETCTIILINMILNGWCVVNSKILYKTKWKNMFELFMSTDMILNNKNKISRRLLKNCNFQFFILQLTLIVGSAVRIQYSTKSRAGNLPLILGNIVHLEINIFYTLSLSFLIWNICLAIKCRYKDMNRLLKMKDKDIITQSQHSEICEVIKVIKDVFGTNNKIVSIFNEVFGWQILFTTGKNLVLILMVLDSLTDINFKKSWKLIMASIMYMLLNMVSEFDDFHSENKSHFRREISKIPT